MREEPGRGLWQPPEGWLSAQGGGEDQRLGWLFLVLVTALALLVRVYRLDHQSLWADEVLTWKMCRPGVGLSFWRQILDMIQGPLYLAVVWPLVRLGGSEFLLRLPAACVGVVTVPVLAWLGQRLLGHRTGRLAALLLALSPFHIWYSQEARGYSFLMFFAVASTLVLVLMARRGPRPLSAAIFALLSACAVWSNMSALFLWGGQAASVVLFFRPAARRDWWLWVAAFSGGLLAAVPWLLKASGILAVDRLVPGADTGASLRGETTFTPMAWPFSLYAFFFGYSLGPSLGELHQPDRLAVVRSALPTIVPSALVAGAALLTGLARLRRRQWAVVLWLAVPLLAVTLLAVRNVKPFNPRYLATVFPFLLLLAAHGLAGLPRRWAVGLSAVLIAFFLWSTANHHLDPRYAKADMRAAATHIAGRAAADEPIWVPVAAPVFKYYHTGPAPVIGYWGSERLQTEIQARTFFDRHFPQTDECWVVLARLWRLDPQGWLPRILAQEGQFVADEQLKGVRLIQWRRSADRGRTDGS